MTSVFYLVKSKAVNKVELFLVYLFALTFNSLILLSKLDSVEILLQPVSLFSINNVLRSVILQLLLLF